MSRAHDKHGPIFRSTKEILSMPKRNRTLPILLAAALPLRLALPVSASAAPSPWWQVVTGSRPSNLWEPTDNVQEIETKVGTFFSFSGVAAKLEVNRKLIGCLGTADSGGAFFCGFTGKPAISTAAQLEATLEAAFGTTEEEVTGGPVGGQPFRVVVPNRAVPPIELSPAFTSGSLKALGTAVARVVSPGGSGRLVVTITNLGDAPVDATSAPVTVVDEMPEGVEAAAAEGFAGAQNRSGPVDCAVETPSRVVCTFEGTLPSYESLEVEVFGGLTGSPPVAGAPGNVTVSGGNVASAAALQPIKVDPAPTPFGIEQFSAQAEEEGGAPAARAGGHPFQLTTTLQFNAGAPRNSRFDGVEQPAQPRNVRFALPAGFVGNATALPRCPLDAFFEVDSTTLANTCPDQSAIGVSAVTIASSSTAGLTRLAVPVFNLAP